MIVVSAKLFEELCHPERTPKGKLKKSDLVARDIFTGETMKCVSASEYFKTTSTKSGRKSKQGSGKKSTRGKRSEKLPFQSKRRHFVSVQEFFSPK